MATTVTLKPNAIDISGSTSGTTTLQATAVAGTTTLTLPAATDTLVGKATTDTLTNKTLTTPVISQLSSASATALTLQSAGTTAITVDTSQNVGIGTGSPSTQLQMNSGAATYSDQLRIRNTNFGNADIGVGSGIMAVATDMSNIAFYTSSNLGTTGSAVPSNERMRIDSSGLVGIGTTTPSSFGGGLVVRKANTAQGVTNATAQFSDAVNSALWVGHTSGATNLVSDAALTFGYTNGTTTTERMRIDSSGNLLVGTTSVFSSGKQCIAFTGGTVQGLNIRNNADNPADTFVGFYNAYGTKVGSITAGGSTTTYNTSSDYRLKENVQPLVNALDKVMALRPVSYTWKSGGEDNGFIAHELQLILPKAVSGEKDAVNEDDTINPQGVDYSKIVATLTAAIQEQQALITALTNRIAVLEAK